MALSGLEAELEKYAESIDSIASAVFRRIQTLFYGGEGNELFNRKRPC